MTESHSVPSDPRTHQVIQVRYHPETLRLTLYPASVVVRPGDHVSWQFDLLPPGFVPWIRFHPKRKSPDQLGPFASLAQTASTIWGTVPDPGVEEMSFQYRAAVQARWGAGRIDEPASLFSETATLTVRRPLRLPKQDSEDEVEWPRTIRACVTPYRDSEDVLVIEPSMITIFNGDKVVWEFAEGILSHNLGPLVGRVDFTQFSPSRGSDGTAIYERLGPFTSMDHAPRLVIGSGSAGHPPGAYRYKVSAVRQATNEVVKASTPDPVIDDLGEPPDPP